MSATVCVGFSMMAFTTSQRSMSRLVDELLDVSRINQGKITLRREPVDVAKVAAETRVSQIRALCATAKQPELADGYIAGALTTDAVRTHLAVITAKLDRIEIDGGLPPDQGPPRRQFATAAQIYAERNRPLSPKKES